jgi:hypothetical protein
VTSGRVQPRVRLAGVPPIAMFLLLPLIDFAVARITRNGAATALSIGVTSFVGLVVAILGPAIILIVVNLST